MKYDIIDLNYDISITIIDIGDQPPIHSESGEPDVRILIMLSKAWVTSRTDGNITWELKWR